MKPMLLLVAASALRCAVHARTLADDKLARAKMKPMLLLVAASALRCAVHASEHQQQDADGYEELRASLISDLPPELQTYRPPECPCIRYTPWSDLTTEQKQHASNLGYGKNSWNHHRQSYNTLEDLYWPALSAEQQSNATKLGYDHHKWTCCANHYEWHHWGHMGNWWPEAQIAYSLLGYYREGWNRDFGYPASAYKHWCRNVTGEEEGACFTKLELFALQTVCFGSESVFRYDSLARPIWGQYYRPQHCFVEDEKKEAAQEEIVNEDDDEKVKEGSDPTANPSVAPTPSPIMTPTTPMPTKETYEPTGEPTGPVSEELEEGNDEMATSSSSACASSCFHSMILCVTVGIGSVSIWVTMF